MDKPSWIQRKPGGGFHGAAGLLERSNGWHSIGVSITAESCTTDSKTVSEIVPEAACSLWCVAMLGRIEEIEIFESERYLTVSDDKTEQRNGWSFQDVAHSRKRAYRIFKALSDLAEEKRQSQE